MTYLLDGGNNNNLLDNEFVFNPNPDAMAEFRILTATTRRSTGAMAAGVVSVVTKSGTNEFHGSAYDFPAEERFRCKFLFQYSRGLPRKDLKRNQYRRNVRRADSQG